MRKFSFSSLAAMTLCGAMATGTAWARGNEHGKEHDRHQGREHARAVSEHRQQGRPAAPPGWDHGRKTGWRNCDAPPGQAKKAGCEPVRARRAKRRDEWRERRRREALRDTRRRQQRREAWQRAQQRRAQVTAARQNAQNAKPTAPRHNGMHDRDYDRH